MAKRISITSNFISETKSLISKFGAVRYDALIKYIELYYDISVDTAVKIVERLLALQHLIKVNYAKTPIVKTTKDETANYDNLDAFETFLYILEEEKNIKSDNEVSAAKTGLPTDFVFYTDSGLIYDVIINNDRGSQKLKLLEKTEKKRYKNQITLFVITSGTDLSTVKAPKIQGKHRFAVVRRSDTGRATCAIGAIEGTND